MEVKVYVDVLFIINFIIDYILLSVTSFFVKKTPAVFKMCISSFIGALFAATVFFLPINAVFSLFFSAATAFLMVFVAFGAKKTTVLIKDVAIFYLVAISASGVGFAAIFSGKASQIAVQFVF